MTTAEWQEWSRRLADVLVRLQHREFVILSDVTDDARYVQALRSGPILTVECSGPSVDGGPAPLTTDVQAALLDLGWPPVSGEGFPNYRENWTSHEASDEGWGNRLGAAQAAALMVETLRVLGVLSPDRLRIQRETSTEENPAAMPTERQVADVEAWIAERHTDRRGHQP